MALVVYLLTLNRWVSLSSLPTVVEVARKELIPPASQPLRFLVLLPFRWLPAGWQPIALNAFSALCASLTLGLLARSVALLPQDRTREQRQRARNELSLLSIPGAWVSPVFAAIACGLQLTFWEHATAATGEMLDLLLFAYVIRCLLESRIDNRESWLTRSALVYGIAATNNYAMIGFFPAYLMALIWIKGTSFFQFGFVARMFGWGAAGLTLYLLSPVLNAFSDQSGLGFLQALRFELAGQKNALLGFPRYLVAIASLTSLVPCLLVGIRWPSTFGETSPVGAAITALLFRVVHAALLAAGIWVVFEAPFGPRMLMDRILQQFDEPFGGVPFLRFYYLGALCLGYFVGYFLLVSRPDAARTWQRVSAGTRLVNGAVTSALGLAVFLLPAGLVYKNLPLIRASDGSLFRELTRLITRGWSAHDVIALSDEPFILSLTQHRVQQAGTAEEPILADTRLLPSAAYQESLHKRFPRRWPAQPEPDAPMAIFDPRYLMYELSELARSNDVYYLHPSFGYYFEPLYLQPHGVVYQLALYPTNAIAPPPLTDGVLHENQKFWADARPALDRLAPLVSRRITDALVVGRWYSRALNWWGVELEKLGRLNDAADAFGLAHRLNPGNVAAQINLDFNRALQSRDARPAVLKKSLEERVGRYGSWNALLAVNGPIDDPGVCFRLGEVFASQSLFRQAALVFRRVLQLEPDNLEACFRLANAFLAMQRPDQALEITREARARRTGQPFAATNLVELTCIEAMAHFGKGDTEAAEKILLGACQQHPKSDTILDTLFQVYVMANRLTNALTTLDEQLKLKPDNLPALLNKAYVCMKLEAYDQAKAAVSDVLKRDPGNVQALLDRGAISIQTKSYKEALEPLNQVLKLQPGNQLALMNRAIAHLQSDQLNEAQRDYETLQKLTPNLYRVEYGLAEIAFRRKDVPTAIRHSEAYLKYAPPDTDEAKQIAERLKQLKASAKH